MHLRRLLVLLAALALPACYTFTPVPSGTTPATPELRIDLTDAGSVLLAPLIGPSIIVVDGRLVTTSDTAYAVALTNAIDRRGVETTWKEEQVIIPKHAVARVAERHFDRKRSWVAAAVATTGTALAALAFKLLGGDTPDPKIGGGGGGPR